MESVIVPGKEGSVCQLLWFYNPMSLLNFDFSTLHICESNNINNFSKAFILTIILGVSLMRVLDSPLVFVLPVLVLAVVYRNWLTAKIYPEAKTSVREKFTGAEIRPDLPTGNTINTFDTNEPSPDQKECGSRPGVIRFNETPPTARNPFMNVLLDEIKYNPTRPPAEDSSNPANQVILNDFFRIQWFSDPTDVFGKTQSQRQFYTMPSTSVPNDQGSYQNWLYLIPGKTCKEGGRDACVPGTNGGAIPWLSQPN